MAAVDQFKSAQDLRREAGAVSAGVLPDEAAETLPVLHREGGRLTILILYYRESGPPNRRVVRPPDHVMYLDPVSGKVIRFSACRPEDLGIERSMKPVAGAGIRPGMTSQEFYQKRERFLDISPQVWHAFASGSSQFEASTQGVLGEYYHLFLEITKAEVAPYYVAAAPDFFGWIQRVTRDH
jgi:hypothetical protein